MATQHYICFDGSTHRGDDARTVAIEGRALLRAVSRLPLMRTFEEGEAAILYPANTPMMPLLVAPEETIVALNRSDSRRLSRVRLSGAFDECCIETMAYGTIPYIRIEVPKDEMRRRLVAFVLRFGSTA